MLDKLKEILSAKDALTNGMHISKIVAQLEERCRDLFNPDGEQTETDIKTSAKQVLDDNCKGDESAFERVYKGRGKNQKIKAGYYKLKKRLVVDPEYTYVFKPLPAFIGKAGEYGVMAELLLNGYNANSMSVDDGIDIVACRDNVVYYVQVKATFMNANNTALFPPIKMKSFDRYIAANTRYILCVLMDDKNNERVYRKKYVTFTNEDIKKYQYDGLLLVDANGDIRIKLKFDKDEVYIYHQNKIARVSGFNVNKFL